MSRPTAMSPRRALGRRSARRRSSRSPSRPAPSLSTLDAAIFDDDHQRQMAHAPVHRRRRSATRPPSRRWSRASARSAATSTSSRRASARRSGATKISIVDRFAQIEAEIAALKERSSASRPRASRARRSAESRSSDVMGLRSSLHDLAAAHTGAVAAITRRLDRIEVMVGISTDMTSSVADPARPPGGARRPRRKPSAVAVPSRTARRRATRRAPGTRPPVQRQAGEPAGRAAAPVQAAGLTPATFRSARTLSCPERVFAMHEAAGRFFRELPMRSMPLCDFAWSRAVAATPRLRKAARLPRSPR